MSPKPPEYVEKFEFTPHVVRNPFVLFFGGLKFGLTVLALILIASTIGEFLPQPQTGPNLALEVVFHTRWYQALLVFQLVNLVLNTYMTYVEKTYPQFLPIFRKRGDGFQPLNIKHKATFKEVQGEDSKSLVKSLATALVAKGYRVFYDDKAVYAHRGLIARFGSTITHLGLITILLGALAESIFKEVGELWMIEGETLDAYYGSEDPKNESPRHPMGIEVTLHDFEFKEYPGTGQYLKFLSTATFKGAKEGTRHDFVRVNHDITYGGWTFHQDSFNEMDEIPGVTRHYVGLTEQGPGGETTTHRIETFLYKQGREITPLPGYDDRFLSVEMDESGQNVIWTVASKEKILARGSKSIFDLQIEMVDFNHHYALDDQGLSYTAEDASVPPAALIEISSANNIVYRGWVHGRGSPHGPTPGGDGPMIDLVMLGHEIDSQGDPIATVSLRSPQSGESYGERYELSLDRSTSLTAGTNNAYRIEGAYDLETFRAIPTFLSILSVSKNPGIPIVYFGSIFAVLGPVIAFFVSRRRIWGYLDWNKKTLWLGGESRYSRESLADELAQTANAWAKSDEVGMKPPLRMSAANVTQVLSEHL